jgi:coenzyme F420-0:L-glutamate ligase/coenzyme F420-1:gamma-L-glutamate ligase
MSLILTALDDIPLVKPGDNLVNLIITALITSHIELQNDDVLIIAQKIVSKAEGRLVNLTEVLPSKQAIELAEVSQKDPRFVELILRESREILRVRPGTIVVEHNNGFICANAGIDHSNVNGGWGRHEDWVLLLPKDSDSSAQGIRNGLHDQIGVHCGVLIIDSHGRAWRNGITGAVIGLAGIPGLVDLRGTPDLYGYELRITQVAAADELAAAGSLVMGQASEGTPVVHARGFPYQLREGSVTELIRDKDQDLFR